MGIIIKQSIRNALISYSGVLIGFISTVYLFPNILQTDQFGLTRTMIAVMVIGSQLVSLGIPSAVIKFFPYLSSKSKNPKGLFITFLIPVLISFILFAAGFVLLKEPILEFYSNTELMSDFFFFFIPLILFSALFNLLKSYVGAHLDTVFDSFLQDILLRIIVIADLIAYYFGLISFNTFIAIFVLNYGLQVVILFIYALNKKYFNFSVSKDLITKNLTKEIGTFSLFSFMGGLTMMIVGNIDMLMISSIEGLAETGIYAIAFYVGSVISIPKKAVSKISLPLISHSFEQNKFTEIAKVYKQTSLNQFLFGFLIFIGAWANIDNLYQMLPKEYSTGSIVILIIGAANLIDMVTGANSEIIISSAYYKFGFYFSILLVVLTILLNLALIPLYGITGAAIATATAIFIYNISKMIFLWIKLNIQPLTPEILVILILGTSILLFSQALSKFDNLYIDILIRSSLISILYLGFAWKLNLSKEFNQALKGIYKKYFI